MNLKPMLLALIAIAGTTHEALARDLTIGVRKQTRHGEFSIGFSLPGSRERCSKPYRVWIPGRYEIREERVWVEGSCERVWVPAQYESRKDYRGCAYRVVVRPGHWETIRHPGHFETREVRVWVDGHWQTYR